MSPKLSLHRETLRTLEDRSLASVLGGDGGTLVPSCQADCDGSHTNSATASITRLSKTNGPLTCHIVVGG